MKYATLNICHTENDRMQVIINDIAQQHTERVACILYQQYEDRGVYSFGAAIGGFTYGTKNGTAILMCRKDMDINDGVPQYNTRCQEWINNEEDARTALARLAHSYDNDPDSAIVAYYIDHAKYKPAVGFARITKNGSVEFVKPGEDRDFYGYPFFGEDGETKDFEDCSVTLYYDPRDIAKKLGRKIKSDEKFYSPYLHRAFDKRREELNKGRSLVASIRAKQQTQ